MPVNRKINTKKQFKIRKPRRKMYIKLYMFSTIAFQNQQNTSQGRALCNWCTEERKFGYAF